MATFQPSNSIADFPEDLLEKIFHLLPSQSDVVRCKCVCKRWFSLISDPSFIHHSIHRHHRLQSTPMTLLAQPRRHQIHHCHHCQFQTAPFDDPLESMQQSRVVVAYCNDLILYCDTLFHQSVYRLCNPITKQLFTLPPPPRRRRRRQETEVGLICYPSPCNQSRQCCSTNTNNAVYTYKVVRVPRFVGTRKRFDVEIFSSETGEWSESKVLSPRRVSFCRRSGNMVPYNRILHWMDEDGDAIVAYDPLNDPTRCRIIDSPIYNGREYVARELLGVSGGRLRVLQLVSWFPFRDWLGSKLCVWELEDYCSGRWGLPEDQVWLNEVVIPEEEDPELAKLTQGAQPPVSLLGCHPDDLEVVYLGLPGRVVSCNVSTLTLREVRKLNRNNILRHSSIFPLVHPWWPTPVHPLSKSEGELLQWNGLNDIPNLIRVMRLDERTPLPYIRT
ncbi:hypothetical protein ACOSQ3_011547 [Xanthoceras sorbifolium]